MASKRVMVIAGVAIVAGCLAFGRGIAHYVEPPKRSVVQLGILVAIIAYLFSRRRRHPPFQWPTGWIPAAGFLAWALISIAWSPDPFEAFDVVLHWYFCGALFVVVAQHAPDVRSMQALFRWIAVATACVTVVGLVKYYGGLHWIPELAPPSATFGNRNHAGHVLVMGIGSVVALWCWERRTPVRMAWASVLGCAIAYTYKIGSSAVFLALAAQAGVWIAGWWTIRRVVGFPGWRAGMPSLVAGAAVGFVLAAWTPRGWEWPFDQFVSEWRDARAGLVRSPEGDAMPGAGVAGDSIRGRLATAAVAWRMVQDHPWRGVGVRGFWREYPETNRMLGDRARLKLDLSWFHVHNDYLQFAAELGLVGVAMAAGFLLALGKKWWRLPAGGVTPFPAVLRLAALAGLVSLAVLSLFDFPLFLAMPPVFAAVYLGILGGRSFLSADVTVTPRQPSIQKRLWLGVVVVGVIAIFATWRALLLYHEFHLARLVGAIEVSEWTIACEHGRAMDRFRFGRVDHLLYLAEAELECGDSPRAMRLIERYLRAYPDRPFALATYGLVLQRVNRVGEAAKFLTRAAELVPSDGRVWRLALAAQLAAGEPRRALQSAHQAVDSAQDDDELRFVAGQVAFAAGAWAEAEGYLREFLLRRPEDAHGMAQLGVVLIIGGSSATDGAAWLHRAIEIEPHLANDPEITRLLQSAAAHP